MEARRLLETDYSIHFHVFLPSDIIELLEWFALACLPDNDRRGAGDEPGQRRISSAGAEGMSGGKAAKKLVVFDWNGTSLADTAASLASWRFCAKKFGGRPVDLKTYRETIIIPSYRFYSCHGCRGANLRRLKRSWGDVFSSLL